MSCEPLISNPIPSLSQNSFYQQLHVQKKSETFLKVFCERMRQAQQDIRSTVSVNMFELSCRKRDEDGETSHARHKNPGLRSGV